MNTSGPKFNVYCENRMKRINKLRGKIQGLKFYKRWNIKLPHWATNGQNFPGDRQGDRKAAGVAFQMRSSSPIFKFLEAFEILKSHY
jgi:hypothetical protein